MVIQLAAKWLKISLTAWCHSLQYSSAIFLSPRRRAARANAGQSAASFRSALIRSASAVPISAKRSRRSFRRLVGLHAKQSQKRPVPAKEGCTVHPRRVIDASVAPVSERG
jgi:hypothetical protein